MKAIISLFASLYNVEPAGNTEFSKMSEEAQDAAVDAFLGVDTPNLSESARAEIAGWVKSPSPTEP